MLRNHLQTPRSRDWTQNSAQTAIVSRRTQFVNLSLVLAMGAVVLTISLSALLWLSFNGPMLVPSQDTRITSIIISTGSKLAGLCMTFAFARSAWASAVTIVTNGHSMKTSSLVALCQQFASYSQFKSISTLPNSFRVHALVALFAMAAMVSTSSSFRYESLPTSGIATAILSDVAFVCPAEKVTDKYFCNEGTTNTDLNANTSDHSWAYIEQVNSGGSNTITKYGKVGEARLGAKVILAILPDGWSVSQDEQDLPWMSMWVTCEERSIAVDFSGEGIETNTSIYVGDKFEATVDITRMPTWGTTILYFQKVNESGPYSNLSPWNIVMLGRNEYDGSNMAGVAGDAVTALGSTYLSLGSYGPIKQGLLGAAAHCTFEGETGGQWPEGLWPPLNHTNNTVWGEIVDDQPTLATAMPNYGPGWQYTRVSENDISGGSISYIANNTGSDVNFSTLFTAYIRNQWVLTAYAIPRHSGRQLTQTFSGTGPKKLFISVTTVAIAPGASILIGLLFTLWALYQSLRLQFWVNRVEFSSWWLVKGLRPDIYDRGHCNAVEDDFIEACNSSYVCYCDLNPAANIGHLALCQTGIAGYSAGKIDQGRVYGCESL